MANLADCAVAISKHDIATNPTLKNAIRRLEKSVEGYESIEEYTTKSGDVYRRTHVLGEQGGHYEYTKNDESITKEEWQNNPEWHTYKRVEDVVYNNGWRIDLNALHLCPYDTSVEVADYDDHLTLYFGGRWAFPTDFEDFLNSLDIEWQGAVAEGGLECYDSNIGTHDFGLRWYKMDEADGGINWWVEDTTDLSEEELSKYEKE